MNAYQKGENKNKTLQTVFNLKNDLPRICGHEPKLDIKSSKCINIYKRKIPTRLLPDCLKNKLLHISVLLLV